MHSRQRKSAQLASGAGSELSLCLAGAVRQIPASVNVCSEDELAGFDGSVGLDATRCRCGPGGCRRGPRRVPATPTGAVTYATPTSARARGQGPGSTQRYRARYQPGGRWVTAW